MNHTQFRKKRFQNNNPSSHGNSSKRMTYRSGRARKRTNGTGINPDRYVKKAIHPENNIYEVRTKYNISDISSKFLDIINIK